MMKSPLGRKKASAGGQHCTLSIASLIQTISVMQFAVTQLMLLALSEKYFHHQELRSTEARH